MRRWGVIISLVYAVIVVGLLVPLALWLAGVANASSLFHSMWEAYGEWLLWAPVLMLVGGQAALLFLSVDMSDRRLKARGPVLRSAAITSMLCLIMTAAVLTCVGVAVFGDHLGEKLPGYPEWWVPAVMVGIWAAWAVVFCLYLRGKTDITNRLMRWLLRGSILELLIAVPSHVIVRRRDDCCAPMATSFGITTGIAIMLLSFGPSVLLLYKKRMDTYRTAEKKRDAPVG
ncbi:MAG TPA: hypothetical protein VGJ21_06630 [Terracidiphilus sp.]|jgi:hypothetical protein